MLKNEAQIDAENEDSKNRALRIELSGTVIRVVSIK